MRIQRLLCEMNVLTSISSTSTTCSCVPVLDICDNSVLRLLLDDRDMTDKVTLNYLLIYALAVPYYLFFNVEVTSSWIPGMESLLYHEGWYSVFYATHDPLDNASCFMCNSIWIFLC